MPSVSRITRPNSKSKQWPAVNCNTLFTHYRSHQPSKESRSKRPDRRGELKLFSWLSIHILKFVVAFVDRILEEAFEKCQWRPTEEISQKCIWNVVRMSFGQAAQKIRGASHRRVVRMLNRNLWPFTKKDLTQQNSSDLACKWKKKISNGIRNTLAAQTIVCDSCDHTNERHCENKKKPSEIVREWKRSQIMFFLSIISASRARSNTAHLRSAWKVTKHTKSYK